MRKICQALCLSVLAGAWPGLSVAGFFNDSELLPEIGNVAFTPESVGFVSRPSRSYLGRDFTFHLSYDRGSRKLAEIDAAQFQKRFPGSTYRNNPYPSAAQTHELIGRAGNGVEYRTKLKYCGEGGADEPERATLTVGGKAVRIRALDKCTSVTSVEIVDGQLWLGTMLFGESGFFNAEGIIVQSADGKSVLARIPLPGWVVQVRADTLSREVWAATDSGIYQVDRKFKIVAAHLYYHDFDPSTGEPRFGFSPTPTPGNPLSAIARMLAREDRKSFYEAVRKIPPVDLQKFTLNDFFMCCDFDGASYPASYRTLLPFFVKADKQEAKRAYRDAWRQAACRTGGPEAAQYCSRSEGSN